MSLHDAMTVMVATDIVGVGSCFHTTAATRKSRAKLPAAGKKSAGRVSQSKTAKEDPNRIVEVESDDSPPYLPAAADAASSRGGSGSLR